MCGIAGIVSLNGDPVDEHQIRAMLDAMAHRGPDGRGQYCRDGVALGHLRLSILDPTPAGAQPMVRGPDVLIHNGEVYNYVELAAELRALGERIETGTDTEVILAAYRRWGVDAVRRFNGMFAFALWDSQRRRLLLARDRMGVKPLYLRRTARSVVFASEPPAFLAARPVDDGDAWQPEPHPGAVHDFLARHRVDHSTATFLQGVTSLPPAHILLVEDGVERLVRYWGPPALSDDDRPAVRGTDSRRDDALIEEFRDRFDASVRLRLRADVAIGTCLSGGLDSSAIVATIAELVDDMRPARVANEQIPRLGFHARFPEQGMDESRYAELVARRAGIRLVYRTPVPHGLLEAVLPVLRAQGEPYGGASINAQHAVMSAAHDEGLKVLLDGQGADELLGGYLVCNGLRAAGLFRSGHLVSTVRELRGQVAIGTLSPRAAIVGALRGALPEGVLESVRDRSRGALGIRCTERLRREPPLDVASGAEARQQGTLLARQLWRAMSADGLPALLRYEDRNSMAFGIEARVPFLDVDLVELAVRLPDRLRVEQGVTKVVLRRAMQSRVPAPILARRDKMGFVAPQAAWLRSAPAEIAGLLRGGQVVARDWVEPREVERILVAGLGPGRRPMEQLWRLFVTEAWLRLYWPDASLPGPQIGANDPGGRLAT